MKGIDPRNDPLYLLTKAVEKGDPDAPQKVKEYLNRKNYYIYIYNIKL